jgi:hypothetical protein
VRPALAALAGLMVVALVFWLKLQHAQGVCREAGGRWGGGDCLFEERGSPLLLPPGPIRR